MRHSPINSFDGKLPAIKKGTLSVFRMSYIPEFILHTMAFMKPCIISSQYNLFFNCRMELAYEISILVSV